MYKHDEFILNQFIILQLSPTVLDILTRYEDGINFVVE